MRIGALIIARLNSTRLPGKNMMPILGRPMIELMAERVSAGRLIDKIIIATSNDASDDPLEALANRLGTGCYRGSLENVMERICGAVSAYDVDTVVELLGDNPLVHCDLIHDCIRFFIDGRYDYAATVTKEYPVPSAKFGLFSVGVRVQVYSREAARGWASYPEYVKNSAKHPCAYIYEHPNRFNVGYFEARGKWEFMNKPDLTFAVNYRKNFDLVQRIFENNYPKDRNFSLRKVYEQLEQDRGLYDLMGRETF